MSGEFGHPPIMAHDKVNMTFEEFMSEQNADKRRVDGWRWPGFLAVDIHQSPESVADMFLQKPPTLSQRIATVLREMPRVFSNRLGIRASH